MSLTDWIVLSSSIGIIVLYGAWKSRSVRGVGDYVLGGRSLGWMTVGLSVMATQASAITFLSTPGLGFEDGMRFVQFYFGLPIAMVVISAVFLPIYYKLNVYTAYEYLEHRFDGRMRVVGALLFLIQRGLAAGITLYAPAIILSSVLGWSVTSMVWIVGPLVVLYTVMGGTQVVSQTQKQQMFVILAGMVAAAIYLARSLPEHTTFSDTLHTAGALGRMNIIETGFDPNSRYTIWSGIFGGFFLAMAYFGTDQSQVQRYLSARTLTQSRLGLLFNGLFKVPMQFGILLVGILLFVHHIYAPQPLWFNEADRAQVEVLAPEAYAAVETEWSQAWSERERAAHEFVAARHAGDAQAQEQARVSLQQAQDEMQEIRGGFMELLGETVPSAPAKDADHVFISYVTNSLPIGLIGLLIAVILSAAMSSIASELNALGTTSAMDLYRRYRPDAGDKELFSASRWFTIAWGAVALLFASVASMLDNLIEAVNILGSIFYGTMLGIFVLAFFVKRVDGRAAFIGAVVGQTLIIYLYFGTSLSFLWYNVLGTVAVVLAGLIASFVRPSGRAVGASGAALLLVAGLGLAGCSSDDDSHADVDVSDTETDTGAADASDVTGDDADAGDGDETPGEPRVTYRYDPFADPQVTTIPDDALTVADTGTATGLMVRLNEELPWFHADNNLVRNAYEGLDGLDGWGVLAGVSFVFDGPIAPPPTDAQGVGTGEVLRFVALLEDGVEEVPFEVNVLKDGLIVTPLLPLRPATRHAVVATTALRGAEGELIDPGPQLRALLEGRAQGALAPMNDRYAELLQALELDAADVAFAVAFTTQSSLAFSRAVAASVATMDFAWSPEIDCEEEASGLTRCERSFEAWSWRDAAGDLGNGEPVRKYSLPVSIWLPPGEGPFPLVFFGHGLVHDRSVGAKMARLLLPLGVAVVATDAVAHGEHPDAPDEEAMVLFEFFALQMDPLSHIPARLRDNFRQSSWDKLQLLRLLELDPDLDGDGTPDLDLERSIYIGESFGGVMAPEFLALTSRFDAVVLQLGGGAVTRIIRDAARFALFTQLAGGARDPEGTLRFFELIQAVVDAGDAATWAPHILHDRLEEVGGQAPHLLVQLVIDDNTIPESSSEIFVRAMGLPLVPPQVWPVVLVPTAEAAPLSGNLEAGRLTAGFFQFDRVRRGAELRLEKATHDHTPQSHEAEYQVYRFVESWLDDGTPVIVDPYAELETPPLN